MFYMPDDDTGNALARIAAEGSDLKKPMEIEFFIAVENKTDGEAIAVNVVKLGFECSVEMDDESGDWTCYCSKTLIPDYARIVEIEEQLALIAQPLNGYLDGFGTFGNADI